MVKDIGIVAGGEGSIPGTVTLDSVTNGLSKLR